MCCNLWCPVLSLLRLPDANPLGRVRQHLVQNSTQKNTVSTLLRHRQNSGGSSSGILGKGTVDSEAHGAVEALQKGHLDLK